MDNSTKDLTVFIGRFSPFHNGHAEVLKRAFDSSKAILILVGSSGQARTTKNPFTYQEREDMIRAFVNDYSASCGYSQVKRQTVIIKPIYDHPYNDQAWIRGVQDAVDSTKNQLANVIGLNPNVYITGADRDRSTWYLYAFGNYFKHDLVTAGRVELKMSATQVRQALFGDNRIDESALPESTASFLKQFIKEPHYKDLVREYQFIEEYKKAWSKAPYAPTFNTVDACVIQSGHVLVNIRDNFPGKGLWALPGGFLEQDELLIDGCVRELMEETRIELSKAQLYGSIKSKEIFDHPDRSLRGRTITTCFLFKLDDTKPLPKVKPQRGEVRKVMWIPINEALNKTDMWFEDHLELVKWGVNRSAL